MEVSVTTTDRKGKGNRPMRFTLPFFVVALLAAQFVRESSLTADHWRRLSILQYMTANNNSQEPLPTTTDAINFVAGQGNKVIRYYVLDQPNITRMDIRQNVLSGANPTWPFRWGLRFRDEYAPWEVRFLQALESHPARTYNVEEADYFLLPMPVGGILTFGTQTDLQSAMAAIMADPIFQQYNEKFVIISLIEFMFLSEKKYQAFSVSGWSDQYLQALQNVTVVKDIDLFGWYAYTSSHTKQPHDWGVPPSDREISFTKHTWSLSYSGAASDPTLDLNIPTYEAFVNRTYNVFYHTLEGTSLNNSTIYRHAPVLHAQDFTQPSSVGFDITASEWKQRFRDSKYCLAIRGDNPASRSLWRSIRKGCLPVIVSDTLPYYNPCMRSQIAMSDYAIFIPEQVFILDPAGSINRAINLTEAKLRKKLRGLALMQRMIALDHPQSIFVEAFSRETIASWNEDYHDFPELDFYPTNRFPPSVKRVR